MRWIPKDARPYPLPRAVSQAPASIPFLHPGIGSGKSLYLVRHAEVREDYQGRAYGNLDVPLSEEGERESEAMAERLAALGPDRVLSSPLARARHLGERAAERAGVPLELEADLTEIHRGSWQGRRVSELSLEVPEQVERFYADPWTFKDHGGECDAELSERVFRVVDRILDGPGERIVLATHYNVIRVLVAGALGLPAPTSFALRIDPARSALVVDRDDGWHLAFSNLDRPRPDPGPSH
ncbi:MAG TPA: histidine phosphatase family protein [Planctomycetes bacterium]|nr:histidine phosphatase family protein [Planctomycetota bacterium]